MRKEYAKRNWDVSSNAIDQAYKLLDKDGNGTIDMYELNSYYSLLFGCNSDEEN